MVRRIDWGVSQLHIGERIDLKGWPVMTVAKPRAGRSLRVGGVGVSAGMAVMAVTVALVQTGAARLDSTKPITVLDTPSFLPG